MNTPQAKARYWPPATTLAGGQYRARVARLPAEIAAAQALRFQVFNIELDEGLVYPYDSGLDADPFDAICAHLIVEDA